MKKRFGKFLSLLLVVSLCVSMVTIPAEAATETVVEWNYTAVPTPDATTAPATGGVNMEEAVLTNSQNKAVKYTTASLCVEGGWNVSDQYWQLSFSTEGYEDLTIAAKTRSSGTGPQNFKLQYSLNGTNFFDITGSEYVNGGATNSTSLSNYMPTVSLPSEIDDQDSVYIRFINYDNVNVNDGTVAATGTSNINNIIVMGEAISAATKCATPTASPAPGTVVSGTEITLACGTAGASIYYTEDDTVPTVSSMQYTDAIEISGNDGDRVTISAIAVKDGMVDSDVATFAYTITDTELFEGISILPDGPDGTSIRDAYSLVNGDPVTVTGQVVYKPASDTRLAFLQGVVGGEIYGIAIYEAATVANLNLGSVVTVTGRITIYNSMYEVTNISDVQVIDEGTKLPSPQIVTIGALTADNTKYQNEYVRINSATLGTYNSSGSTNLTQDGRSVAIYNAPAYPSGLTAGSAANITGVVYRYNANYQLRLSDSGSYTETGLVTIAEAKAAGTGTENIKVSGVVTYIDRKNVYIQDETGAIDLYLNANSSILAVGDKVVAAGTRANYGNIIELSGIAEASVRVLSDDNDVPELGTATVAELIAQPSGKTAGYNHMCEIIKVEGATLTALDKLTQSGSEIKIYPSVVLADFPGIQVGDTVDGTLRMYDYGGTLEAAISEMFKSSTRLAVTASPEAGPVVSGTGITLSCRDTRATIYYTNDDTEPTVSSLKYTGPVEISGAAGDTVTISAIAVKGGAAGETARFAYTIQAAPPLVTAVAPVRNSATGDNKTPEISVTLENAGESPTVIMSLQKGNDVVVTGQAMTLKTGETAVYAYTPAALTDGRYTVTVTVTRSDSASITESWSFTVGEALYSAYFGQLHAHTAQYSDGSGTLQDGLNYIANIPESDNVDFVSFTDHSNYFDTTSAANPAGALNDKELMTPASKAKWETYVSDMETFNSQHAGSQVALPGFEMTWSGGPGHINTFNSDGLVSRNNTSLNNKSADAGMKLYYDTLIQNPEPLANLSQFNHPGTTFGTFSDFAYWSPTYDSKMVAVEVGNGEGAIGSGGYFPSYAEYTKALDKGWHVAPTNNQDNHKGYWGNSNTCRTVILTDDFSSQGLLQGLKNLSVYSSEDKNLNISYTVNGLMMGGIIDDVPTAPLQFTINADDPDSGDIISKVEIVSNGGRVVSSESFNSNSADWEFELPAAAGYYYVRVTQDDQNIAVTAPVWVGQPLRMGISSLECGTKLPVTGEELTLATTLFNNESSAATLKSITYKLGDTVLGTETPGTAIAATGVLRHNFVYTPTDAGLARITVTAVLTLSGVDHEFTSTVNLDVRDSARLVYVGIDASHFNEYVDGNYKDNMGNFSNMAVDYDVRVVELDTSAELIDATTNPKYKMLVLTPPTRRNGDDFLIGYKSYSDAEINAVAAFAASGGTVIVTGWGDYYEGYSTYTDDTPHTLPADQHMAKQQNRLLEAIGASLRISDDEIKDNTKNGGQAQRLYLENYNMDNVFLDRVKEGIQVYSNYGGSTIYAVDGSGQPASTLPAAVSPLVYGFDTSYSSDDDHDGYAGVTIPKYGGKYMVAATETVSHGNGNTSTVIVAGSAFMSNFEIQVDMDTYETPAYSNYTILENVVRNINPPVITDIAEVQAAPEGRIFTIRGTATSNASGYDQGTAFFDCIYVQDGTAGINAFPVSGDIRAGQTVEIKGTTSAYNGERQIAVDRILVLDESITPLPAAISETTAQAAAGGHLGSIVTVTGNVARFTTPNNKVESIYVKDSSGTECRVFIDGYITQEKTIANLAVGSTLTATGLSSIDTEGARIRIRDRADVVCTAAGQNDPSGGNGSGNNPKPVTEKPVTTASDGRNTVLTSTVTGSRDASSGIVTATVPEATAKSLIEEAKKAEDGGNSAVIEIKVEAPAQGNAVNVGIPGGSFNEIATGTDAQIRIETGIGSVTFSAEAVEGINAEASGDLSISIAKVASEELSEAVRETVGNRPVYDFSVSSGDRTISEFDGSVEVSLPYIPSAGEDPNAIVVYYIDDSGALQTVRGRYDASTGTVSIVTNHFSAYMIGYNKVSFSDVPDTAWYSDAVSFIAAREITTGTDRELFSPNASLSRGQFIVMLMRAYGISPDENPSGNFADAGDTYYTNYLAAAKRLGITSGTGGNLYAPEALITREDMFTLLYRALTILGETPEGSSGKTLNDFTDAGQIADYGKAAMQSFVENGIIAGSGNRLSPDDATSRAEMAQVMYQLLSR